LDVTGAELQSDQVTCPLAGLTAVDIASSVGQPDQQRTPLSGLTQLTGLSLDANQISDITPLSVLTRLNRARIEQQLPRRYRRLSAIESSRAGSAEASVTYQPQHAPTAVFDSRWQPAGRRPDALNKPTGTITCDMWQPYLAYCHQCPRQQLTAA